MNYETLFLDLLLEEDMMHGFVLVAPDICFTGTDPDQYVNANVPRMDKRWCDVETKWHDLLEANGYDFDEEAPMNTVTKYTKSQ